MSEMMGMPSQDNRATSNETSTSKVKEWVIRAEGASGGESRSEEVSYPSLVLWVSFEPTGEHISKGFRYPWEGFIDVGFRCALSAEARR